jgi:hypothetical protein
MIGKVTISKNLSDRNEILKKTYVFLANYDKISGEVFFNSNFKEPEFYYEERHSYSGLAELSYSVDLGFDRIESYVVYETVNKTVTKDAYNNSTGRYESVSVSVPTQVAKTYTRTVTDWRHDVGTILVSADLIDAYDQHKVHFRLLDNCNVLDIDVLRRLGIELTDVTPSYIERMLTANLEKNAKVKIVEITKADHLNNLSLNTNHFEARSTDIDVVPCWCVRCNYSYKKEYLVVNGDDLSLESCTFSEEYESSVYTDSKALALTVIKKCLLVIGIIYVVGEVLLKIFGLDPSFLIIKIAIVSILLFFLFWLIEVIVKAIYKKAFIKQTQRKKLKILDDLIKNPNNIKLLNFRTNPFLDEVEVPSAEHLTNKSKTYQKNIIEDSEIDFFDLIGDDFVSFSNKEPLLINALFSRIPPKLTSGKIEKTKLLISIILEEDPSCCKAHLMNMLLDFNLDTELDLALFEKPIWENENYIKTLDCSQNKDSRLIRLYAERIKSNIYNKGIKLENNYQYKEAIEEFKLIQDYNYSFDHLQYCGMLVPIHEEYLRLVQKSEDTRGQTPEKIRDLINEIKLIEGYKDTVSLIRDLEDFYAIKKDDLQKWKQQQRAEKWLIVKLILLFTLIFGVMSALSLWKLGLI